MLLKIFCFGFPCFHFIQVVTLCVNCDKCGSTYKKGHQGTWTPLQWFLGPGPEEGPFQPAVGEDDPMVPWGPISLTFPLNVLFIDVFTPILLLFPSPPPFCQICHITTSSFWLLISGSFWSTLISFHLKFLKNYLAVQYPLPRTPTFNFAFFISHFSTDSPQRRCHVANFVLS